MSFNRMRREHGFSHVEVLVVLTIFIIFMTVAVSSLASHVRAYRTEDAVSQIVRMMRVAHSRSLGQRRTMRLTIDLNSASANYRTITITDLSASGGPEDVARESLLFPETEVALTQPSGFAPPPAPYCYAPATWTSGVWTVFFHSDGRITNTQSPTSSPVSGTLFFWTPKPGDASRPENNAEVRAVTFFGPTSAIRYWKYNGGTFVTEVD